MCFFFFQAEDGIRDLTVTGVQTCALPIFVEHADNQEQRPGREAVVELLEHAAGKAVRRQRKNAERAESKVADRTVGDEFRSEERRVGKECRDRGTPYE